MAIQKQITHFLDGPPTQMEPVRHMQMAEVMALLMTLLFTPNGPQPLHSI